MPNCFCLPSAVLISSYLYKHVRQSSIRFVDANRPLLRRIYMGFAAGVTNSDLIGNWGKCVKDLRVKADEVCAALVLVLKFTP